MRNILLAAGVAGTLGLFSACGGDNHPHVADDNPQTTGGRNTGGSHTGTAGKSPSTPDGGAGGAGEQADPDGPVVKITAPAESLTPGDGVLVDDIVHVVCAVTKSTAPTAVDIDPTSVKLSLTDSAGKAPVEKSGTATTNKNEYAADFVLTTVPSGEVSFTCSAADKNKLNGADTLSTFVDHGPTITVVTPLPDSATPVKGGLAIEFNVEPSPLAEDDEESAVDQVAFTLDGKPFKLDVTGSNYTTSIALDNTEIFPAPPGGAITIEATNKRSPNPVAAKKSYNIVVDGSGPVISIDSPLPQAVVGGKVTLSFTVTDAGSGVDPKSVNVALFTKAPPIFFDPTNGWTRNGDKYTYTFDSKALEKDAKVQTTINVRASDKAGNPSASGQSLQLYLDNVPPQIDLDPLNIRMVSGENCSGSFDPVGDNTLNDLEGSLGTDPVTRFGWFRAFVNEQTNSESGQTLFYFSGTNQETVRLYVQPDPANATTPLLVNKNPGTDNTCDDIGDIDDIQDPPPFSALKPISTSGPVGTLWNKDDPLSPPSAGGCKLKEDTSPPLELCPSHKSGMRYVPFNARLKEPFVYVVGTPMTGEDSCAGIDFGFLTSNQPEGWVCVAGRVVDKAGNVGISPPLRVCSDDPTTDYHPPCSISSTTPPTCTDGCIPPARGGGLTPTTQ